MEEKRKFFRSATNIDTKCGVISRLEPLISTYTENVSAGGLCLPLARKVNERSVVELELNLPNDFIPIFAVGEIAWLKKDAKRDIFKAGIEFKAIDDYDRNRIVNYISTQKTAA